MDALLIRRTFLGLAAASAVAVAACVPWRPEAGPPPGAPTGPSVIQQRSTLIVASTRVTPSLSGIGSLETPDAEAQWLCVAGLATIDSTTLETKPWMAEEIPSTQRGTWRINPDGTMVTTWRLRAGITWHDGNALTARDFVFGRELLGDDRVVVDRRSPAVLVDRIETPDDRTLVMHWGTRFAQASSLMERDFPAAPAHLLEALYRAGDYDQFNNHRYWSSEFFHAGPYKLVEYEPGAQLTLEAYDGYFLGRPKIDRIVWRLVSDTNTLLAAVLSGDVDLAFGLPLEQALVVDREWAGQGLGTVHFEQFSPIRLTPSPTSPIFGWSAPDQLRIRRAMLHAINRDEMAQTLGHGKDRVVQLPLSFTRPEYPAAQAVGKTYGYDPSLAERLLEEAGWRRGPDGVLTNQRGDRFSIELRTTAGRRELEAAELAVADYLKRVGIDTTIRNTTAAQERSDEFRNHWPGIYLDARSGSPDTWTSRFSAQSIPTAENRWTGNNLAGWVNPDVERLLGDYTNEVDDTRRTALVVAISTFVTEDLPYLPLISTSEAMVWRTPVRGIALRADGGGARNNRTWNAHLWEKL